MGVNQTEVIWSEPYEDGHGLGQMTTAALPVYYNNSNVKILLGVVGLDVLMSDFIGFETTSAIVKVLVQRSRGKCVKLSLKPCEFENLRSNFKFIVLFIFIYLTN